MSALELVRYATQIPFVLIFLVVLARAAQSHRRVNIDVAVFFGAFAALIAIGWAVDPFGARLSRAIVVFTQVVLLALPYFQLRLVSHFASVPWVVFRLAEAGLVVSALSLAAYEAPHALGYDEALVAYFVVVQLYVTYRFALSARAGHGVTRRRMEAIALGGGLLAVVLAFAGLAAAFPTDRDVWTVSTNIAAFASAVAYFAGYAPPMLLRRAWRAPDLRRFFLDGLRFIEARDLRESVARIEEGAASAVGAPYATVLLWDAQLGRLVAPNAPHAVAEHPTFSDGVYAAQMPRLTDDAPRNDPVNAEFYRRLGRIAILAAPMSTAERPLGVLAVHGPRASIFAEDDLALVELLASQAAVLLESRRLLAEAATVRAADEATQLKNDFLSAAAHDLKTPLTTLLGQAQLMERRALREPLRPADLIGVRRLVVEAQRMRHLVNDLLDASRAEQTGFVGVKQLVDLVTLAREFVLGHDSPSHKLLLDVDGPVMCLADRDRMRQVLQNLIDNSVKYHPEGGEVEVGVRAEDLAAHLWVRDRGIGIPRQDLTLIFERFQRGSTADDRQFAGMGLGLYLCRRILEEHGGRIWAESEQGRGSTFHVMVPIGEETANGG